MRRQRKPRVAQRSRPGFTLIELAVVILIIGIVSAATLAVVIPAYQHRGTGQAALLIQSMLAGSRDAAIRSNAPRGFRLIPDTILNGQGANPLAANRLIAIETAPDYNDGAVRVYLAPSSIPLALQGISSSPPFTSPAIGTAPDPRLGIFAELFQNDAPTVAFPTPPPGAIPSPPTSWYWNIRQGERIRFTDSGRYFTIAGPMTTFTKTGAKPNPPTNPVVNPERFLNLDTPGGSRFITLPVGATAPSGTVSGPEVLFLVNGQDDDGDGYIDNSFDGIDNDGDGLIDPGFNGIDDDGINGVDDANEVFLRIIGGTLVYDTRTFGNPTGYNPEFEHESPPGVPALDFTSSTFINQSYTIERRAVPSQGAREVLLPADAVIDLTTANLTQERSRLPVDPFSGYVDVLIGPNGSVMRLQQNSGVAEPAPFYHFWIAERSDVFAPVATLNVPYLLPMPTETIGYPNALDTTGRVMKGDRRLVTLFTKTGQITTNTIDSFDGRLANPALSPPQFGVQTPFLQSQLGLRASP
jgi:prepilin-type N-terminal cleavage/methylation domain-containing protein